MERIEFPGDCVRRKQSQAEEVFLFHFYKRKEGRREKRLMEVQTFYFLCETGLEGKLLSSQFPWGSVYNVLILRHGRRHLTDESNSHDHWNVFLDWLKQIYLTMPHRWSSSLYSPLPFSTTVFLAIYPISCS